VFPEVVLHSVFRKSTEFSVPEVVSTGIQFSFKIKSNLIIFEYLVYESGKVEPTNKRFHWEIDFLYRHVSLKHTADIGKQCTPIKIEVFTEINKQ